VEKRILNDEIIEKESEFLVGSLNGED
jgi:hypothetical protein